jgi:peptidoglycan/xylan/chitin deacetylase (PgdA/CDA1 family)
LTFDDGPSTYRTKTLRTLREKRVPATFSDLGMRVAANPQFAGFEAGEGHLVLSHGWSHWDMTLLSPAQLQSQLASTEAAFGAAGAPLPFKLLRPPYGDINDAVAAELKQLGYGYVLWDDGVVDWEVTTTARQISDAIVNGLHPGAVILLHDGPVDTAGGAADEVALPRIIDRTRALGYCFGQLNELGQVVPARLQPSENRIPTVVNPVPYLPIQYSGDKTPPRPYVVVQPSP